MLTDAPIEMLKTDHRKVESLFEQFKNTSDNIEKHDLAQQAFNELEIHAKLEEKLFYPQVQNISAQGLNLVLDARLEHEKMKQLIKEMRQLRLQNQNFHERFKNLLQIVMQHIKYEEEKIFPLAEQHLAKQMGLGMTAKMLAEKTKLKTEKTIPIEGMGRSGTIK